MDEVVAADDIPDQQNEEDDEAEVLPELTSGDPEDLVVEASDLL